MFRTLSKLVNKDSDLPNRSHDIDVLSRFLDGTIYDVLGSEFHQERDTDGKYIPIAQRSPSVRSGLLRTVVSDSVSFLFSDGRFPKISCGSDEKAETTYQSIVKDCKINQVMLDAALRGSVGSIVIWLQVLDKRLFFKVMPTVFLTPEWKITEPDRLAKVVEQYKVKGKVLKGLGYVVKDDDLGADFWFKREWDSTDETWFTPWLVIDEKNFLADGKPFSPTKDDARSVKHNLGFVPMVWIVNLPGGDDVDGWCTFRSAIDTVIEIDYLLSQGGRGLKYSSAPTTVIKTDSNPSQPTGRVAGDDIILPTEGDAKLLEIGGDAAKAVSSYVQELRKMALESVGGSRADSDKLSAATSGRAMEMMNQPLIWLADKLRVSYGEGALVALLRMIGAVSRKIDLVDSTKKPFGKIAETAAIELKWPKWYSPTSDDRQADALALTTLKKGGIISTDTAIDAIASDYEIEDVQEEKSKVDAEQKTQLDAQLKMKARPAPAAA